MSSMIIDLQKDILDPNKNVIDILRKAKLIAAKLELDDFEDWISKELNGYPEGGKCPEYRKVKGVLKARDPFGRWIETELPQREWRDLASEMHFIQSIAEIIETCNGSKDNVILQYTGDREKILRNMFDNIVPVKFCLIVPKASVLSIIEKVKNEILDWTSELEKKGIVGKEMFFSDEEKAKAKEAGITLNVFVENVNCAQSRNGNIQLVSGTNNNVNFNYEYYFEQIKIVKKELDSLGIQSEEKTKIEKILNKIEKKITKHKKPSTIKKMLSELKDLGIQVGAGIIVSFAEQMIAQI